MSHIRIADADYATKDANQGQSETIEQSLEHLCRQIDKLCEERCRIALILARFAAAPISISSIQPLLELNDELNGHVNAATKGGI